MDALERRNFYLSSLFFLVPAFVTCTDETCIGLLDSYESYPNRRTNNLYIVPCFKAPVANCQEKCSNDCNCRGFYHQGSYCCLKANQSMPHRRSSGTTYIRRASSHTEHGFSELLRRKRKHTAKSPSLSGSGLFSFGRSYQTFVRFSAYRESMTVFHVVGLASTHLMYEWGKPVIGCGWLPGLHMYHAISHKEAPLLADAAFTEVMFSQDLEAHKTEYLPLVVKCVFPEEVGDATGGTLLLQVPKHKGHPRAHIFTDDDLAPVFHESAVDYSIFREFERNSTRRLKTKYAVCGAPMRANVNATIIREWVLWHSELLDNDVKFIIYVVEELSKELMSVLNGFVENGKVEIVYSLDHSNFESWYYNQVLFINDCIHRLRHVAVWAFSIDYDEFLFARNSDLSVSKILDSCTDKAGIIFWRVTYSVKHCLPMDREGAWATELRAFRAAQSGFELFNFLGKTCPPNDLRCHTDRFPKWVANLKNVLIGQIHDLHKVVDGTDTEQLLGHDLYAIHFRGFAAEGQSICEVIVDGGQNSEGVTLDRGFAENVSKFVKENHLEHKRAIKANL